MGVACDGKSFGSTSATVGRGSITKLTALEVLPPGAGFVTLTAAVPPPEMSVAEICAVNCVLLTNVVGRAAFCPVRQFTMEVGTKLLPVTVNVNPSPPAITEVGLSAVTIGLGLDPVPDCVTVKVCPAIVIVPARGVVAVFASTE